jgi:HSP20 family protein
MTMYRTFFPRDVFAEFDRLQRQLQTLDGSPSIRGLGNGSFPPLNVGGTPGSVEVYAFVPGIDPANLDVTLERGVLSISGERSNDLSTSDEKASVHIDERFAGRFRRVVSLPEDIDSDTMSAACNEGVLHISVKRLASTQPRRIAIQ